MIPAGFEPAALRLEDGRRSVRHRDLMTSAGFEPASSRIGIGRPSNWATRPAALAVLITCGVAWADPPADSPVMAPDVPGLSVRLRAGETAPFDGRLVELDENQRRGAALADCRGELASAKTNEWLPKPVLIAIIVGTAVLAAAAGAGAAYAATR